MREFEVSELQARWDLGLNKVQWGQSIVITLDGRRIARIVPDADCRPEGVAAAIHDLKEFRRNGPRLSVEEILAARHEGHKY